MKLIDASRVTLTHDVPEAKLKEALIFQAAEAYGLTTGDALTRGVSGRVDLLPAKCGTTNAGYRVELTFNRTEAGQTALPAPGVRDG